MEGSSLCHFMSCLWNYIVQILPKSFIDRSRLRGPINGLKCFLIGTYFFKNVIQWRETRGAGHGHEVFGDVLLDPFSVTSVTPYDVPNSNPQRMSAICCSSSLLALPLEKIYHVFVICIYIFT